MKRDGSVSARDARRLALGAQGLARSRPANATARHVRTVVGALQVLQLDAINVLERTQFVVPFSRVGSYDQRRLLAMNGPQGALYETWGHAASWVPMEHEPLFRWKQDLRQRYGDSPTYAPRWRAYHDANRDYLAALLAEITERGALAASQLGDPRRRDGEWWHRRSEGRVALEFLFGRGELAGWRTASFERVYDLPERVIPAAVRAAPTPSVEEAQRALLLLAARASGVATVRDLASYFVIKPRTTKVRVDELVEDGALRRVQVEGWSEPGYVVPGVRVPTLQREHATVVSPFDSLVWDRARVKRIFGFDFRIEVYVPAPKREFGYYVLPVLVGDELVARVDLKADRATSALRVQSAFAEPDVVVPDVADALARELDTMRAWLGLDTVTVAERGDLARALATAVVTPR